MPLSLRKKSKASQIAFAIKGTPPEMGKKKPKKKKKEAILVSEEARRV